MKKSFSQTEDKTKTILETIEDGYYELDLAGNFTFFNDALCRMHGRSKKELMGLNYRQYLDEENIKILFQTYNKVYKTGNPIKEFGLQFKRKDGTKIYIEISISLKKDSSGKLIGFRGIVRDVNERSLMADKLKHEEKRFKALTEQSPDMIVLINREFKVTYINPAVEIFLGLKKEEVIGSDMYNYLHPDDFELVAKANIFTTFFKDTSANVQKAEIRICHKDGTWHPVEAIGTNIVHDNVAESVVVNLRDITERKKAEEFLRQSEEKYRNILENMEEGFFETDLAGNYTFFNDSLSQIHGYPKEELMGMNNRQYTEKEVAKKIFKAFNQVYKTGKPLKEIDWQIIRKDGVKRYIEASSVSLLKDAFDNPIGFRGILRDITERRQAEDLLRQSEEKYRLLAEHTKDSVWITDLDLNVTYLSPSTVKLLGWTLEEFKQLPLDKRLSSSSLRAAIDFYSIEMPKAISASPDYVLNRSLELEFICKNGQTVWVECMFSLIRDENGKPVSILGESREITQRKQMEDELRASESNFRHSFDESPLGVRISTVEGETIYANRAILDMYGYDSIEELKNKRIKQRYTPESYAEWKERKKKRLAGESGTSEYEISIVRKNGEIRHLHVFRKEIFWDGKKQSQIIYQDVTLHRQAEKKIHQSEEKYRTILENIEDGYYEVDLAGNFTFFNDSMCRILGYNKEEMMGINNRQYTDNENSKKLFRAFNEVYKTGKSARGFDWQITRKDGTKRYIETSVSLLKDSSGKLKGFRGIVADITERKMAEEKLQQTLESLKRAVGTTIQVLVTALEARDPYTAGHQSRSADLACAIAAEMGFDQDKIEGIRMAGIIHDIGKLSIPSEILSKPTKLTNLEFSLIKEHPQSGYEMIKDVESPWQLAEIIHQHHERMNGTGYPKNLKGDEILIEARILAVADVVEAMASHRPYRASLGIAPALEEIEKNKGILYDEAVADACLRLFREKGYQLKEG